MARYRVLFFGTDDFAGKCLHALYKHASLEALEVRTKPAKLAGRGLQHHAIHPINRYAETFNIPVKVFEKQQEPDFNLAIAASFGQLLTGSFLSALTFGGINVHPSLLPQYRGPAPVHRALLDQQIKTGCSLQTLHPTTFDAGQILAQKELTIPNHCTYAYLYEKLGDLAADILVEGIAGGLKPKPLLFNGEKSYAPKVTKADSYIDFATTSAEKVLLKSRVFETLWTTLEVDMPVRVQLRGIETATDLSDRANYWQRFDKRIVVQTKSGAFSFQEFKPAGGVWQPASNFPYQPKM